MWLLVSCSLTVTKWPLPWNCPIVGEVSSECPGKSSKSFINLLRGSDTVGFLLGIWLWSYFGGKGAPKNSHTVFRVINLEAEWYSWYVKLARRWGQKWKSVAFLFYRTKHELWIHKLVPQIIAIIGWYLGTGYRFAGWEMPHFTTQSMNFSECCGHGWFWRTSE